MPKYRDPHTGAVRESTTPLGPPYVFVADGGTEEELEQEAQRRAERERTNEPTKEAA